jgi:hypothetical protein
MMTIERFKGLVEAYGANPARWPEAERAVAEAFANATPEAQRLLAEAAALDHVLAAAPTAPVTRELEMRVLDSFSSRKTRRAWLPDLMPWTQAAALAASLVLGMFAGSALPAIAGIGETSSATEPAMMAFGDFGGELLDDGGDGI